MGCSDHLSTLRRNRRLAVTALRSAIDHMMLAAGDDTPPVLAALDDAILRTQSALHCLGDRVPHVPRPLCGASQALTTPRFSIVLACAASLLGEAFNLIIGPDAPSGWHEDFDDAAYDAAISLEVADAYRGLGPLGCWGVDGFYALKEPPAVEHPLGAT